MSITIKDGATSASITGGTDRAFSQDGQTVQNGVHLAALTVTDFRVRPHVTIKNRNPQRQTTGAYSKGKREIIYTEPFLKADGTIAFNTWRYIQETDPETTAANELDGRLTLLQFMSDSEMEAFNSTGAIPS